jgi:hypothetical protein
MQIMDSEAELLRRHLQMKKDLEEQARYSSRTYSLGLIVTSIYYCRKLEEKRRQFEEERKKFEAVCRNSNLSHRF